MVSVMKTQRECSPTCRPKAAPGLYTSVKRRYSPIRSCGTRAGESARTATAFVTTSMATTAMRIGQKSRPLIAGGSAGGGAELTTAGLSGVELSLCIFLALLAVDAIPRVRQRVETLVGDVLAAVVALAESLRRLVEPPQRLIDVPEETAFLAREEERLLALHRVRALVRHVE